MCQWLPLPNSEFAVCFACTSFNSRAGILVSEEPIRIHRGSVKEEWVPSRIGRLANKATPSDFTHLELIMVRAVYMNAELISSMFYSWLGKQMLEELVNEQE